MCVLRAYGEHFDVERFLDETNLHDVSAFRKGERVFPESSRTTRCYECSGIQADVSDKEFDDLDGQIRDAIQYLNDNRADLARLASYPGVEEKQLDFPYECRLDEANVVVQGEYLPAELIQLAGEFGLAVALTLYPRSNGEEADGD